MNEELIKNIIKCKLTAAEKILDRLPSEMSNNLKGLGRLILCSINENCHEIKEQPVNRVKLTDDIKNIKIE